MKEYKITFLDQFKFPEIKQFPDTCLLLDKPEIGEIIEIGENHFVVVKIVHIPTVQSSNYNQLNEPTIIFVEFD